MTERCENEDHRLGVAMTCLECGASETGIGGTLDRVEFAKFYRMLDQMRAHRPEPGDQPFKLPYAPAPRYTCSACSTIDGPRPDCEECKTVNERMKVRLVPPQPTRPDPGSTEYGDKRPPKPREPGDRRGLFRRWLQREWE